MLGLIPVAVIAVFLTQHVSNYAGDIQSFVTTLWRFCKESAVRYLWPPPAKVCEHQQRREQMEAGLWEVRARTYRQSVQFMVHAAAFGVVGMIHDTYLNPSWNEMFSLFSMASVYVAHHSVCKEKLKLNAMNLRGIYILFYTSFFFFVLFKSSSKTVESGRAVIDQGFNSGSRMIMSVIFIDTLTAVPAQLLISVAEMLVHARHSQSSEETLLFAWMQIIMSAGIIIFSVVLEFWVTSHLTSLMDTESMVCSFRRMLRGVSDGDLMLSEDLRIAEDSDCLKHLLMTQSKFKGKDFERLLVEEEVDRFQEFIKQSMAEAHKPEEQRTKTPPCLRLSLRGVCDLRVGVDVWHVSMPGRKDGVRHLLALREDSEARRQAPDASGKTPEMNSPSSTCAGEGPEPSECSMSQKSSTSMLMSFPELVQMTLCVDTSTHWFDIEQAHLSFVRQPQSSDHSMPSLRRLVRATDWETVRAKLKAVEEGALEEIRLRLVDDAKRVMIANQVQVSTFKPPHGSSSIKLCLQFSELVFEENKCHREQNLAAINE